MWAPALPQQPLLLMPLLLPLLFIMCGTLAPELNLDMAAV
jgi:hypothetical protein